MDNTNFSDSYGTIEVWGRDSIMLCAMDETGAAMGCVRVYHSSNPLGIHSREKTETERLYLVYPNPSDRSIQVEFESGHRPSDKAMMQLVAATGQTMQYWRGNDIQNRMTIDLSKLSAGNYTLTYLDDGQMDSRNIVVSD